MNAKLLIIASIVSSGLLAGCKTSGTPIAPILQPGVAIAADCGTPAVQDLATHLLDDVASAVMVTGDWRAALSAVASRAGTDGAAAVKCAVGELLAQSSNQLALRARMEKDAADRVTTMHDRALAWLSEHAAPLAADLVPMRMLVSTADPVTCSPICSSICWHSKDAGCFWECCAA